MKKFLRRLLIFLLVVSLLVGGFLYWEHQRGEKALAQWKEEVAGKGAKLEFRELLQRAPEETDPTPVLLEAVQAFTNAPVPLGSIDPSTLFDAGRIRVIWQQRQILGSGMSVYNWRDLDRQLQPHEEKLKKLREALVQAPARLKVDHQKIIPIPNALVFRKSAHLLASSAQASLHTNNLPLAFEDLKALASLARMHRDEPLLVILNIRSAVASIGIWTTWHALQSPGWSDAQLADLQQSWQQVDLLTNWVRTFEMERALVHSTFKHLRQTSYLAAKKDYESQVKPTGEKPLEVHFGHYLVFPIWKFAWSSQMEKYHLARAHSEVEVARQALSKKSTQPIRTRPAPAPIPALDKTAHQTTEAMKPIQAILNISQVAEDGIELKTLIHLNLLRTETTRQLLLAAIALKRFQLAKGKPPEKLEELVPEFLPSLPIDWMDGQTLRYRLVANKPPLLYSVGNDLKDDNGNPAWKAENLKSPGIWDGTDAVWPVPSAAR